MIFFFLNCSRYSFMCRVLKQRLNLEIKGGLYQYFVVNSIHVVIFVQHSTHKKNIWSSLRREKSFRKIKRFLSHYIKYYKIGNSNDCFQHIKLRYYKKIHFRDNFIFLPYDYFEKTSKLSKCRGLFGSFHSRVIPGFFQLKMLRSCDFNCGITFPTQAEQQ